MKYFVFFLALFSSCTSAVLASPNDLLHIVSLQYRNAKELIPVLQPLLKPDDGISGTGYQLFIRTDDTTLKEVQKVLKTLDRKPRNLIITVTRDADNVNKSFDASVSGTYKPGKIHVSLSVIHIRTTMLSRDA